MRVCYFCGTVIDDSLRIYRETKCPNCGRDLKICYNCEFYSPGSHWDCRESIPEAVREKDRANFCEYFRFKEVKNPKAINYSSISKRKTREQKSKENFNKLFGG